MAWFSDKEKIILGSSTTKLVSEEADPIKDAVITAVVNDREISNLILSTFVNGLGVKAKRYYKYARDGHYTLGLPVSNLGYISGDYADVESVIESQLGYRVRVTSVTISRPQAEYFAKIHLQDNYNWNITENRYYKDSLAWEYVTWTTPDNGITIHSKRRSDRDITDTIVIPYPPESVWYHATYRETKDKGADETIDITKYWVYDSNTNAYPELPNPFGSGEEVPLGEGADFLPVVPIRRQGTSLSEADGELYTTGKKLLKKINLRMDDLIDNIETNGDIEQVDDCYFMFGVDVYTEVTESARYVFNLFGHLQGHDIVDKAMFDASVEAVLGGSVDAPEQNYFLFEEDDFKLELRYDYIEQTTKTGEMEERYELVVDPKEDYTLFFDDLEPGEGATSTGPENIVMSASTVMARRNNGNGTYLEFLMHGPVHVTEVAALGETAFIRNRLITPSGEVPPVGSSGFFFPVAPQLLLDMNLIDREKALYDSMLLHFTAADVIYLKWYQQDWFLRLVQIIAIVVAIVIFYLSGGFALKLSAFVLALVETYAYSFVINYVLEMIMERVGGEAAIILTLLIAAYAASKGNFSAVNNIPFAEELLIATQAITKTVKSYTEVAVDILKAEIDEFTELAETREEELEAAQDLLGDGPNVNPLLFVDVLQFDTNEPPGDFYTRTIHTGNPGVLSLEAIETSVARALELPKYREEDDYFS